MSPVSAMPAEEIDARHKGLRSGRLAVIVIVVVACATLCAIAWGAESAVAFGAGSGASGPARGQ
jgi:hypothetical protein